MKYTKTLILLVIIFATVALNASQKDATQSGAFRPECEAGLFIGNRFNPIAQFTVFAPRGAYTKELVNRYANYMIPSKQEVILSSLDSFQAKPTKMQPSLNKLVQKSEFSTNISYPRTSRAVGYIANRVVYGPLDMGIDAGYSFLQKQFNSK